MARQASRKADAPPPATTLFMQVVYAYCNLLCDHDEKCSKCGFETGMVEIGKPYSDEARKMFTAGQCDYGKGASALFDAINERIGLRKP